MASAAIEVDDLRVVRGGREALTLIRAIVDSGSVRVGGEATTLRRTA